MIYTEDDYLMLSGIQNFAFCRRQWALMHIEQQWTDNALTVDGTIMHEQAHNPNLHEKRNDTIITRAMAVSSPRLGISGECDVVEFQKSNNGIQIYGIEGNYDVIPIEYKRGSPKENDCDKLQLTAQALCLEDMLCCNIPHGYIYYGEIKRKIKVTFDQALRQKTEDIIKEMHELYKRKYTPKVKRRKGCNSCSLKNICLPVICGTQSAAEYIRKTLEQEDNT